MALQAGTTLGPYRIDAPLGAGGMGEVYKATDTRLDRTVAIKVLPAELASDPERRERFEREAKTISSLNHPHICTLHDVGHQNGIDFLVMEHLEGDTLQDRLTKGALPLDQALRYAIEIADALDKAHRQGIVHRDLKPGNIMLTKAGAKLLDFGLAKLRTPAGAAGGVSALPTQEANLTAEGSIVGTFQYMAPEQLEGREADTRSDVFAFGAVVHEMVSGQQAFGGESAASVIVSVLNSRPPELSTLASSPLALDRLVHKCLEKDPDGRWQSASDLGDEIRWISHGGGTDVALEKPPAWAATRAITPMPLVTLILGSVLTAIVFWVAIPESGVEPRTLQLSVSLPADLRPQALAVSPDGETLVISTVTATGTRGPLLRRATSSFETVSIAEDAESPFFSPDGRWVAFRTSGGTSLRRVAVTGGDVTTVTDAVVVSLGSGAWGPSGRIVFGSASEPQGLVAVSDDGGASEPLTTVDTDNGELSHWGPRFLSGGRALLFHVNRADGTRINLLTFGSGERVELTRGSNAQYAPTGHLVFRRGSELWAVAFDLERLETLGQPAKVLDDVADNRFVVTRDGDLVYIAAGQPTNLRQYVWVDRQSGTEQAVTAYTTDLYPRISPDGSRVVFDARRSNDIFVLDLERDSLNRLTFDDALDMYPVWAPDGQRVAFGSRRSGPTDVYWKAADGTGQAERLTASPNAHNPYSFAPSGLLVFREEYEGRPSNLAVIDTRGDRRVQVLMDTPFAERNASVSPDGRWLAYQSNETGQEEVFVRPFPDVHDGRWQVSVDGGMKPRWGPDVSELFYMTEDGRVFVVHVEVGKSVRFGRPEVLLEGPYSVGGAGSGPHYDVAPDGQRFLMARPVDTTPEGVRIVLDWARELERLLPTP